MIEDGEDAMGESRDYRKDFRWAVLITIGVMILHLFVINIFVNGKIPGVWIGSLIGSLIGFFVIDKGKNKRSKETFLVSIVMIGNFILFKNDIYIPDYIVFFASIGLTCVYYLTKMESKYKLVNLGLVFILFIGFFSLDYYMYSNRLIKDRNLYRAIKHEYNITGKIDKNSLKGIEKLNIGSRENTNSLKGIEHFEDLKTLYIWEGQSIKDLTPINLSPNLEHLMLWYINLEQLQQLNGIETLEWIEIIYPKKGELSTLDNLSSLKHLELQGINLDNLNGLIGAKKLEKLSIAYGQVGSLDGIESFPYLKEVSLSNLDVIDISPLFRLENIENISLHNCKIDNDDERIKNAREKGIKIEIINTNNDFLKRL